MSYNSAAILHVICEGKKSVNILHQQKRAVYTETHFQSIREEWKQFYRDGVRVTNQATTGFFEGGDCPDKQEKRFPTTLPNGGLY